MDYLVSANWLQEHLDDSDLVILDCTNSADYNADMGKFITISGRHDWEAEHILGSRYADFANGLSGDDCQYQNTLPYPLKFAAIMGQLEIGDSARVVLYDSESSMWAARLWWMLRWIGFDNAAVLDGGLPNWKAAGGETTSIPPLHRQVELSTHLRSELFVTKEVVKKALSDGTTKIVDALDQKQFDGSKSDLGLCGHIPGAINIPAESLLDPITGRYLPKEQLAERLPENRNARTIVYCGSGIAAASVAFTMCRIGFSHVAIYMPGFQEWIREPNFPQSI